MAFSVNQVMGMNAQTGEILSGMAHLKQSIGQILTTRIGERVMRRKFGAELFDLIDYPASNATLMQMYSMINDALKNHEPRLKLTKIYGDYSQLTADGKMAIIVEGQYLGEKIAAEVLL